MDEIGELPLNLQSKLLRVMENGEFYRVGETQPRKSGARIIVALLSPTRFRQDLYHRLSVLAITTPPLREREDDALLLLEHFRNIYAMNNTMQFELEQDARDCLRDYTFPGNVRELRNIVIRLCAKYPGKIVGVEALRNEMETEITGPEPGETPVDVEYLKKDLMSKSFRLEDKIADWERHYITTALDMSGGNLSKAARLLGLNRTTLYSRIQRLSIKTPE